VPVMVLLAGPPPPPQPDSRPASVAASVKAASGLKGRVNVFRVVFMIILRAGTCDSYGAETSSVQFWKAYSQYPLYGVKLPSAPCDWYCVDSAGKL
jgi:hypothetical protein